MRTPSLRLRRIVLGGGAVVLLLAAPALGLHSAGAAPGEPVPTGTLTSPAANANLTPAEVVSLATHGVDTPAPGYPAGIQTVEWWLYSDTTLGDSANFSTQYPGNTENKIFLGQSQVPSSGTTTDGVWTTTWTVPTNGTVTVTRDGEAPGGLPAPRTYQLPKGVYSVQSHLQNAWWNAHTPGSSGEPGKTQMQMVNLDAGGATCTASAQVCAQGRWNVLSYPNTVRAIHSVLLSNGNVLFMAGSGNDPMNFAAGSFKSTVWNPSSGRFTDIPTPADLFCSGHVQLPNGNVLVMGGTAAYPAADGSHGYEGLKASYIFNVSTNSYQRVNDMNTGHWYPSATELGNGDVLSVGGLDENSNGTVETERFKTSTQSWMPHNSVPQTYAYWGLYPDLKLMQDGRLFYSGSHVFGDQATDSGGAAIYNYGTASITGVPGLREANDKDQSAGVLLPPAQSQKVMVMGGGNVNTNVDANRLTDLIDLSQPNPTYSPGPDLPQGLTGMGATSNMSMSDPGNVMETGAQGKMYVSAVTLPDRTVLETGGALHDRADPVYEASVYHPVSNTFTSVAADPVERMYHSESLLLPDGRVLSVGSNPGDGSFDMRISIYSPAYLFHSTRPSIASLAHKQWGYGSTQALTTSGPIVSASLLRPAAVTHQSDPNQRLVDLPLTSTGKNSYHVTLTNNHNIAPPGYYMLTVLRADGTPSPAKWVHLG